MWVKARMCNASAAGSHPNSPVRILLLLPAQSAQTKLLLLLPFVQQLLLMVLEAV